MTRAQELRDIIATAEAELEEIECNCEHDPGKVSEAKTSDGRRHIGMHCKKCGHKWGEPPDGLYPEPLPEHLRERHVLSILLFLIVFMTIALVAVLL